MKAYGASKLFGIGLAGFVGDEQHFAAQEGTLMIQFQEFEPLATLCDNVHAAVIVGLGDCYDLGGAADLRNALFLRPDHAEHRFFLQALADHLPVARLENVQGQGDTGEQYNIQREEREQTQGASEGHWQQNTGLIVRQQLDFPSSRS